MLKLTELADPPGLKLTEDCAHTTGASWAGKPSGIFGKAGRFGLQAYKHVNAGESGRLVTWG